MIIRKLRLQRAWSQEQLSECSGLSIRTIQRIERGQKASVESLKSLAAVFEVNITDLTMETDMSNTMHSANTTHTTSNNETASEAENKTHVTLTSEEQSAIEYVKDIKDFYSHLTSYVGFIAMLAIINWVFTPEYYWFVWPALGWGFGIISHALSVFEVVNFFSPDWEKRQIEKRLGRKL